MSGGGGNNTTTVANSQPWEAAQPFIKNNMQLASKVGPESFMPFQGSTVVPFAGQTQSGLDTMERIASENISPDGLVGQYQNTINQGGISNPLQQTAAAQMGALATGANNPYFEEALQNATDSTMDAVNMGASSAGRYGSGAHTGVLAREIGNLQTQARSDQFNQDLTRQMQASGNLFNMGQQAFQNIGNAYQGAMQPANTLGQVGSSYEDLMGRTLNDQIRIWEGNQQAPINAINYRNAIFGGAGSMGGSSTSTAQMPGRSPWATGLGLASAGLGLFGGGLGGGLF